MEVNPEREEGMNMELRAAREASGKTQAEVAKEVGIKEVSYQRYEYDKRTPDIYIAQRIAKTLNTTVAEIFPLPPSGNTKTPDGNQA